ncbi:MAG: hypothetical protein HDR17_16790 [Lachnospiraceae bacterium]|nr:hypothetical protein [Lachnospiraceae bacterium]
MTAVPMVTQRRAVMRTTVQVRMMAQLRIATEELRKMTARVLQHRMTITGMAAVMVQVPEMMSHPMTMASQAMARIRTTLKVNRKRTTGFLTMKAAVLRDKSRMKSLMIRRIMVGKSHCMFVMT